MDNQIITNSDCCRKKFVPETIIANIAEKLCRSYQDGKGVNDAETNHLPHRAEVTRLTEMLLELIFPGFDDQRRFFSSSAMADTAALLAEASRMLATQIRRSLRSKPVTSCRNCPGEDSNCLATAEEVLASLPDLREIMKLDIAAAVAGDPAATSEEEIILAYPGIKAITIQRIAHILYCRKIPILPRMMTEYAHALTGIDIHPGAVLGKAMFIDHGTGVVIGETAIIGDNVQIYQGVTLGAFSFPKDACGMLIRNTKRHPTIGDRVTIYANATILGDIEVGHDSVVGGNVWLSEALPPHSKISMSPPQQRVKTAAKTTDSK